MAHPKPFGTAEDRGSPRRAGRGPRSPAARRARRAPPVPPYLAYETSGCPSATLRHRSAHPQWHTPRPDHGMPGAYLRPQRPTPSRPRAAAVATRRVRGSGLGGTSARRPARPLAVWRRTLPKAIAGDRIRLSRLMGIHFRRGKTEDVEAARRVPIDSPVKCAPPAASPIPSRPRCGPVARVARGEHVPDASPACARLL